MPGTAKILRITYVGMQTIEVNIKSGTMKIVMKPDAEVLEEVVVTGMTKMDKRLFTGAATKLSSEDVKLDGLADISRSLEGRAGQAGICKTFWNFRYRALKYVFVVLHLFMVVLNRCG